MTPENLDARRDALAILSGALREDHEGVGTVVTNCDTYRVIACLAAMLFGQLRERGIDPAGWVQQEQEHPPEEQDPS